MGWPVSVLIWGLGFFRVLASSLSRALGFHLSRLRRNGCILRQHMNKPSTAMLFPIYVFALEDDAHTYVGVVMHRMMSCSRASPCSIFKSADPSATAKSPPQTMLFDPSLPWQESKRQISRRCFPQLLAEPGSLCSTLSNVVFK